MARLIDKGYAIRSFLSMLIAYPVCFTGVWFFERWLSVEETFSQFIIKVVCIFILSYLFMLYMNYKLRKKQETAKGQG